MIDENLLTLILTVIIFLVGQLAANIFYLSKLNTRLTRVETIVEMIHGKEVKDDET